MQSIQWTIKTAPTESLTVVDGIDRTAAGPAEYSDKITILNVTAETEEAITQRGISIRGIERNLANAWRNDRGRFDPQKHKWCEYYLTKICRVECIFVIP